MEQKLLIEEAKNLSTSWANTDIHKRIELYKQVIDKIVLSRTCLDIFYSASNIANLLLEHANLHKDISYHSKVAVKIKRCGVETKLIVNNDLHQDKLNPHAGSLKAIQQAVRQGLMWNQALITGKAESAKAIAANIDVSDRYVCHCIKLAFLSPDIIKRIFRGEIPHDMTLTKLKSGIPLDWKEQDTLFA